MEGGKGWARGGLGYSTLLTKFQPVQSAICGEFQGHSCPVKASGKPDSNTPCCALAFVGSSPRILTWHDHRDGLKDVAAEARSLWGPMVPVAGSRDGRSEQIWADQLHGSHNWDDFFLETSVIKVSVTKPVVKLPTTHRHAYTLAHYDNMTKPKPCTHRFIYICIYIHTHIYRWYTHTHAHIYVLVAKLCQTLCNPTNYSPPGFSVHGISQIIILEWIAIPFSRGSSPLRDFKPGSPALQAVSLPFEPQSIYSYEYIHIHLYTHIFIYTHIHIVYHETLN